MSTRRGGLVWFCCLVMAVSAVQAKDSLRLPKGARVGVVNLLDPEVAHLHASKDVREGLYKTYEVTWPLDSMLQDAVKKQISAVGLEMVPVAVTDNLDRSREHCFDDGSFWKQLPPNCVAAMTEVLTAHRLDALIVLGPGLNNREHAGSDRMRKLPDYLRGWGFVTGNVGDVAGKPGLFNMTEMVLVAPSPEGAQLRGHIWGGVYQMGWEDYQPPADLHEFPQTQIDSLRSVFAGILQRQGALLMEDIDVIK